MTETPQSAPNRVNRHGLLATAQLSQNPSAPISNSPQGAPVISRYQRDAKTPEDDPLDNIYTAVMCQDRSRTPDPEMRNLDLKNIGLPAEEVKGRPAGPNGDLDPLKLVM
ncbi:uncharacterized protein Z519_08864 [Cladophialophora bantiana CBS 173.52]|uniref:Uncharacterized protein n=1 Tax=Cladophialophora bantiana (strain ATCC 10958 / CBS 173.52 / CDC B-1940 / NIH 8579) TaxID=1442370 RepID=A0A0D2HHF3_CLAB1|nr:uncharacterized protein Z519_08864 [Cladophialophora bantiana CBS 173.52]KIW90220.1 hypothetical protein Z519_08864 [Cladophialophora bantiana CBS 173.52]